MPEINILQNIRNKQKLELRRSIVAALKFESKLGGGGGWGGGGGGVCILVLSVRTC